MKIRIGSTRIVFVFKKFVIKFPIPVYRRFLYGIISNLEESYRWNLIKNKDNQFYAPVYFSDPLFGLFLVMKTGEEVSLDEFLTLLQTNYPAGEDFFRPNMAKINNQIVFIDYGVKQKFIHETKFTSLMKRFFKYLGITSN